MYQNEMKEGFIQDYMRSRIVAKTSLYGLFRKLEQYEERLGKDCSQFTKEEIINTYKEFRSRSVYVLLNNNTILKAYCAWLRYYHKANIDFNYEEITIEDLKPLIPKEANTLLSREEITDIEDQLYNWTDKAIIEALYEGLNGNSMRDLVGVEKSMIDEKAKQLHLPDGRVFELTDRLCDLLLKACEETEYVCYGSTLRVKKLIGAGKLYKERDNAHAMDSDDKNFRWIYRKVKTICDYIGINGVTMKGLAASGMCHYLKEGMKETGLDLKEFLRTEFGEKIMDKYGYYSEFRVDNVAHRYSQLI